MTNLSRMQNLRGGMVYEAAEVAPTTVRTWGVKLGKTEGSGHPRYDVSDVTAVILMRELTSTNMMAAGPAAVIVNALRDTIAREVEEVAAQQRLSGEWTWEGGKFVLVRGQPDLGRKANEWMEIVDADQIGNALMVPFSGVTPIVISLLRLINSAILSLDRVLWVRSFRGQPSSGGEVSSDD